MKSLDRSRLEMGLWLVVIGAGLFLPTNSALAQANKGRPPGKAASLPATAGAVRQLDARASKLQDSFVRETKTLASEYEQVGQFERAKVLYEALLKLDEKDAWVKDKVDQLTEQMFAAIEFEVSVDVSKGWAQTGAFAISKRAARIETTGGYQLSLATEVSPDGLQKQDASTGLIDGMPLGAVVGMLLVDGKPTKPFLVGRNHEWTPEKSGLLLIKVNAPAGHRSTGQLKLKLSGFGRVNPR